MPAGSDTYCLQVCNLSHAYLGLKWLGVPEGPLTAVLRARASHRDSSPTFLLACSSKSCICAA